MSKHVTLINERAEIYINIIKALDYTFTALWVAKRAKVPLSKVGLNLLILAADHLIKKHATNVHMITLRFKIIVVK